ncbi:MAG: CHASE2 domain-containing protein [Pleurocapsa sp. SU_5_0]|nr:CHASE2 domain-containing protein [Pleurocapsa sp. SU_5_0]NJR47534.1 CHASE2 domain-containing protein [Hyellaceae cyanobacterium CSU_1_1]
MSVYIVALKITEGSFATGFTVTLQISQAGLPIELEISSQLPAAPHIPQQYDLWQTTYLGLGLSARLESKGAFISNYSHGEYCDRAADKLLNSLNNWLDANSFRPLKEKFLAKLNPVDEIRILIQTKDIQLQCLPWHLINWFESYPKAEIALSQPCYEQELNTVNLKPCVRILAIIGNSQGIDTNCDRHLLEQLPNSEITLLTNTTRQEITEQLWDDRGWDLLFFAGHSQSDRHKTTGCIQINHQDSLTTKELKYALTKAVAKGLKIAIFNSCDGLGLAQELGDLNIPQLIVMREPVPDKVAQEFLKYFLTAYAKGESFYLAVREARAKLQGLEDHYPCATWLPVIVQNPASIPPAWQQLYQRKKESVVENIAPRHLKIPLVLASSAIATVIVIGLRFLGVLQGWELTAFDYLSQKLPSESGDRRILIIGADEQDISRSQYGYPISDHTLSKLINKLQQHQPAVIGVDIFRDYPIPEHNSELTKHWQQSNVVSICLGDNLNNSVAPPPTSPLEQVGFDNIYSDLQVTNGQDDHVRRYLLSRSDNPLAETSYCRTNYSFALQLVARYFQSRNMTITTVKNNWQFGSQMITRLVNHSAGYQKFDDRGNQLLISYRRTPQLAQQVTIRDILQDRATFDPNWIKNRIVLIGVTAKSVPDVHDTPIGEIRGLYLHAQVVSQLVSAVEDNRSLIWWLPFWGDWLWIGFWSIGSGLMINLGKNYLERSLILTGCVVVLSGVCWLILTQGGWFAWIPGIMAIAFTTTGMWIYDSVAENWRTANGVSKKCGIAD